MAKDQNLVLTRLFLGSVGVLCAVWPFEHPLYRRLLHRLPKK